jgi:hypothetical protein
MSLTLDSNSFEDVPRNSTWVDCMQIQHESEQEEEIPIGREKRELESKGGEKRLG